MADKINLYSTNQRDLYAIQNTLDKLLIGKDKISLTHMSDTTVPAVAAGSIIEVAGAIYYCNTERVIQGTAPTGIIYVIAVPDGDNITFVWTATPPTWSDAKQGWYGTGASAGYKYLPFWISHPSGGGYYKNVDSHPARFVNLVEGKMSSFSLTPGVCPYEFYATFEDVLDVGGEISSESIIIKNGGFYEVSYNVALGGSLNGGGETSVKTTLVVDGVDDGYYTEVESYQSCYTHQHAYKSIWRFTTGAVVRLKYTYDVLGGSFRTIESKGGLIYLKQL